MTARSCIHCNAELGQADLCCKSCGQQVPTLDAVLSTTARDERGFDLPPMRLRPGTMVSVYRIDSVLGEGGMGVVYKAWDEVRARPVALKCLHSNLAGDIGIRRRFLREAKVMRGFTHPNVVAIHDLVEQDYLLAIVMEFVDGQTLARYLEKWRGRVPLDEIGLVFREILEAIDEAHRRGVVHRDLKPENVLLEDRAGVPHAKVVDFGIAKVLEGTTYTMSGALLGTCRYMSPEQVRTPQLADLRSDVYSLGVTLYEMCTGKVPFDDGNHFAVMMAHVNEKPRPPRELRADLPRALEELVLSALEKDPRARPQTCREFLDRLDAALANVAPVSRMTSSIPLPPSLRDSDGSEMVLVPAGPFQMGASRRAVALDAFYVDRLPVTNAQFKSFLAVTRYTPTEGKQRFLAHWHKGEIPRGQSEHPVVNVSWHDVQAYASWAGKRLPSEAEWEKAARGTDGRNYPWGRAAPTTKHANFGKARGRTTKVGSFPDGASPYGILDAAGNVWEWCEDADDPAFYEDGPSNNPRNLPQSGSELPRVMRGGSWMYDARSLRTFSRTSFEPHYRFAGGGFRCARSA